MSFEPHRFSVRVYYEDTDFSGVVYHANYLRYLERGRTEMLRVRGIGQADLFANGGAGSFGFAVVGMEIAFRRPARMDDVLEVETEILSIGGATLRLRQALLRDAEVLVEAKVRIATLSGGRAARLPPEIAAKLKA